MRKLTEEEAKTVLSKPRTSTLAFYPWDDWTDGSWWTVEEDDVPGTTLRTFQMNLYNIARARNLKVSSRMIRDNRHGDNLAFKFSQKVE